MLRRLNKAGYQAHLVGGGVRDLLLGREPKDFDVATDASPEQVKEQFRNCRLIGRRFRLAHVHFGREIIEVATFRCAAEKPEDEQQNESGMLLRDNVYGNIEEDALRRDFSINALYYNVADFSLLDYADGLTDLNNGVLRMLGDAETRYREDPVRMLRAIRFAAKLGFQLQAATEAPLYELGSLLQDVPAARLLDECNKMLLSGYGVACFEKLRHYGLFGYLFAQTESALSHEEDGFPITFVERGLENSDKRVAQGKPVTPAFLFAVLLWEPVRQRYEKLLARGSSPLEAMQRAGRHVVREQVERVSIPKRFGFQMYEIWEMQYRLQQQRRKVVVSLLLHRRFRAAYDFLWLRGQVGEVDNALVEWWTHIQTLEHPEQQKLISELPGEKRGKRRRRKKKKPSGSDESGN